MRRIWLGVVLMVSLSSIFSDANAALLQLCTWLNEKRDMETSSRLIPLVDDLTHILIEAGKNKLQ
jgi:hypothetical protein